MEIYVHIPFCVRKCAYCSFVSFPSSRRTMEAYVAALLKEAKGRACEIPEPVETLFIGGGTPSLLPSESFCALIAGLKEIFHFEKLREFTVEANPGTLTEPFLEALCASGVTRVSLGMQSAQEDLLRRLGRIHTFAEVQASVSLLRSFGITNCNLDLMFGIPFQTLPDWQDTLSAALSLSPKHISAYGLIPEEGTPLFAYLSSGEWQLPPPEKEREMYDLALETLSAHGFEQYEISNFALPGFACLHNIGYWDQIPYLGLGLSAASMRIIKHSAEGMECLRRTNPSNMKDYLEMVNTGDLSRAELETVSPAEARFETLMLALRMTRGVSEERFLALHGVSLDACFGEKLRSLESRGLLIHEKGAWRLSRRGMDIQNSILVELM